MLIKSYYKKIIQFDLINKFKYNNTIETFPYLKRIVLNFGCKSYDIKILASTFFTLKLITKKNSLLIRSKQANLLLKLRKGNLVGCKIVLKKNGIYPFFLKVSPMIAPKLRMFTYVFYQKSKKACFSFTLKNLIIFKELKQQFFLFNLLPPLNITFIFNNITTKQIFFFFLHSFFKKLDKWLSGLK